MIVATNPAILNGAGVPTLVVPGLLNYYRFKSSGDILVDEQGAVNLTVDEGSPAWNADNKVGGAGSAVYDGDDNHNWAHSSLTGSRTFSISAWIKCDNTLDSATIIGEYGSGTNNFAIRQNGSSLIWSIYRTTGSPLSATSTVSITANTWMHVVGRMSGSQDGSISVNNETPVSIFTSGQWRTPGATWQLGANTNGSDFFSGRLSDVALIDASLSDATIGQIYNSGNGVKLLAS